VLFPELSFVDHVSEKKKKEAEIASAAIASYT
jgi:hypothetical protein